MGSYQCTKYKQTNKLLNLLCLCKKLEPIATAVQMALQSTHKDSNTSILCKFICTMWLQVICHNIVHPHWHTLLEQSKQYMPKRAVLKGTSQQSTPSKSKLAHAPQHIHSWNIQNNRCLNGQCVKGKSAQHQARKMPDTVKFKTLMFVFLVIPFLPIPLASINIKLLPDWLKIQYLR